MTTLPRTITSDPSQLRLPVPDDTPSAGNDMISNQIELVRKKANDSATSPKQLQSMFQSTIMICASLGREETAIELLHESETHFTDAPEARAKLFSSTIEKLIEKGFHVKLDELYKEALERGVWTEYPDMQANVAQKLVDVGFKIGT